MTDWTVISGEVGFVADMRQRMFEAMEARSWTQTDLARECDVPKMAISRWLRQDRLELWKLHKMCSALGISPRSIMRTAKPIDL